MVLVVLVQLVVGTTDADDSEQGLAAATQAFTYRVLLSESGRQSCPFARESDSPQSIAFWRSAYSDAMISLGAADEALTARDMYDVLDQIGSILSCCPGLLQNPADDSAAPSPSSSSSSSSSSSVPSLPSCGLLSASVGGSSLNAAGGGGGGNPSIGYELTLAFSSTLRAGRLPSVALEALHDAAGLVMSNRQRAGWEAEMALVLLQMGRVGEAVARLKSALRWDSGDLRVLQPLGAALVAQGKVAAGVFGVSQGLRCTLLAARGRERLHTSAAYSSHEAHGRPTFDWCSPLSLKQLVETRHGWLRVCTCVSSITERKLSCS